MDRFQSIPCRSQIAIKETGCILQSLQMVVAQAAITPFPGLWVNEAGGAPVLHMALSIFVGSIPEGSSSASAGIPFSG